MAEKSYMTDEDRAELVEIKRTVADAKKRRQRVFARARQRKRRDTKGETR